MGTTSKSMPLLRNLGVLPAIAIVVGVVIGTGVFLKTAVMAQHVGSMQMVLAAWAVAGVLSLLGAMTYAELSAMFPHTGGEYVFLREGYGSLPAFLYGWTRFWIISPGSIAAYAVGASTFLNALVPLGDLRLVVAIAILIVFTTVNCLSVTFTGHVQSILTAIKVVMISGLIAAIFIFAPSAAGSLHATESVWNGWPAFGSAVLAALWAFDGWSNLPLAAGEIREPQKTLPLALAGGTILVFFIYAAVNVAYFYALPMYDILISSSTLHPDALPVATKAAQAAVGPMGVTLLSVMFVLSALGAMNGSILTGARVPYAMACDGLFFKKLAEVHGRSRVPVIAVLVQGVISIISASLGTFDQLTDYVIFASWIFYALVAASLFIFRNRITKRPFSVPGYPWLPAGFIICSLALLLNTVWTAPKESGIGLLLIAAGVPVYWMFKKGQVARAKRV